VLADATTRRSPNLAGTSDDGNATRRRYLGPAIAVTQIVDILAG